MGRTDIFVEARLARLYNHTMRLSPLRFYCFIYDKQKY